jgi:hypothetical protein
MSRAEETRSWKCPECGAAYRRGTTTCWLCGLKKLRPPGEVAGPSPPQAPVRAWVVADPGDPRVARGVFNAAAHFFVSGVLLVMTLAAILYSLFEIAPGLALLITIFAVPIWLFLAIDAMRSRPAARPRSGAETFWVVLRIIAIVITVTVLGPVALFIALAIECEMSFH